MNDVLIFSPETDMSTVAVAVSFISSVADFCLRAEFGSMGFILDYFAASRDIESGSGRKDALNGETGGMVFSFYATHHKNCSLSTEPFQIAILLGSRLTRVFIVAFSADKKSSPLTRVKRRNHWDFSSDEPLMSYGFYPKEYWLFFLETYANQ